jgi:hypothetical protein
MEIIDPIQIEDLGDCIKLTAGSHILKLPPEDGIISKKFEGCFADGVFLVISEKLNYSVVAYDEVTAKRLWIISDEQIQNYIMDKTDGIIGVTGSYKKDGTPSITFNSSWGDISLITEIMTGKFEYLGCSR